jgi:hypothetical protein
MSETIENAPSSPGLDLLWGVRLIAKTVGRTERAMFSIYQKIIRSLRPKKSAGGGLSRELPFANSLRRLDVWPLKNSRTARMGFEGVGYRFRQSSPLTPSGRASREKRLAFASPRPRA